MPEPSNLAGLRVAYLLVHDLDYPRNRLIRQKLEDSGAIVEVFSHESLGRRNPMRINFILELKTLLASYDLAILSEFQLRYALPVFIATKLTRIALVVDGFVGRFETAVGDWGQVSAFSFKALVYRAVDAFALIAARFYLIDNDFRGERLRSSVLGRIFRKTVITVPVGAPSWATPIAPNKNQDPCDTLNVLYYGNYIPLHGLDLVLEGVAAYGRKAPIRFTLIGNGDKRIEIERRAQALGIDKSCQFLDSVPEEKLATQIGAADVVFGVFGNSIKARSVIANKVWQSLAMGKRVVTRRSIALDELDFVSERQLIQVIPDPEQISDALSRVMDLKKLQPLLDFPTTYLDLDRYVNHRAAQFVEQLSEGTQK